MIALALALTLGVAIVSGYFGYRLGDWRRLRWATRELGTSGSITAGLVQLEVQRRLREARPSAPGHCPTCLQPIAVEAEIVWLREGSPGSGRYG